MRNQNVYKQAKKSLGQNFFTDPKLAQDIVEQVLAGKPDVMIEIGPGRGAFTEFFYKQMGGSLLLVEIDDELAHMLKAFYRDATVIHGDILDEKILKEVEEGKDSNNSSVYRDSRCGPQTAQLRTHHTAHQVALSQSKQITTSPSLFTTVFGALPYNISKPIIRKLLENNIANEYWFIIQKEVAEAMTADKSSQFKLFTQIYADTRKVKFLSSHFFSPRPKVDSMLIQMTPNDNLSKIADVRKLERLIKAAFRFPRKTLANNLKGTEFEGFLRNKKFATSRAEDLQLSDFIQMMS